MDTNTRECTHRESRAFEQKSRLILIYILDFYSKMAGTCSLFQCYIDYDILFMKKGRHGRY